MIYKMYLRNLQVSNELLQRWVKLSAICCSVRRTGCSDLVLAISNHFDTRLPPILF